MKPDFKQLDKLIEHLRSKGVVSYKGPDLDDAQVELVLLPSEPPAPEKDKPKKSVEERLEGVKRGADGLTAEQQEDLYGAVIDAQGNSNG